MPAQNLPEAIADKPNLNEILLNWKSLSHPYKKREKVFYQVIAAFSLLTIIIVYFLFQDLLLIGAIVSVVFVIIVVSRVPPIEVEHRVTPLGFENAGRLYRWIELYAYWFEKRWDYTVLVIHTRLPFPAQVRAVVSDQDTKKLHEILGKYLMHLEKPPKSMIDSLSRWLSETFPLESSR